MVWTRAACLARGEAHLQDAAEYFKGFLDPELQPELEAHDVDRGEAKRVRIGILTSPLYTKKANHEECIHWIPGWLGSDLPPEVDGNQLVKAIIEDAKDTMNHQVAKLLDQKGKIKEDESVLHWSLDHEIEALQVKQGNLTRMLQELWHQHQIIGRPTVGDGNCGVQMSIAFAENTPVAAVCGKDADSCDLAAIVQSYREDISKMWEAVCNDLVWQQIWERFLSDRVDLQQWRKDQRTPLIQTPRRKSKNTEQTDELTPPQKFKKKGNTSPESGKTKKRRLGLPFTPDKASAKSHLVPGGEAKANIESVTASGPCEPREQAEQPPAKKKKNSGKKLPIETTMTFSRLFQRFLSEANITYKEFNSLHREIQVLVCLVGHVLSF